MKIRFANKGDFSKTTQFLERVKGIANSSIFDKYGELGVKALAAATPVDTGLTASSWEYIVEHKSGSTTITWLNTNVNHGVPIAVILQYGHGTGTGGWVSGVDYINPALEPVFNQLKEDLLREVSRS